MGERKERKERVPFWLHKFYRLIIGFGLLHDFVLAKWTLFCCIHNHFGVDIVVALLFYCQSAFFICHVLGDCVTLFCPLHYIVCPHRIIGALDKERESSCLDHNLSEELICSVHVWVMRGASYPAGEQRVSSHLCSSSYLFKKARADQLIDQPV